VIAGTHSGVGKTTVATGLLAALRRAGHRPAGAKVGPDFIDPGYHSLASGRPPRNLDAWLCGADVIPSLAGRAAHGTDVLVVEGVMGLFDGAGDGSISSTADVAGLLDAPVILVVDASAMSASVAAVVHGFASWRPNVNLGGVVLNQVGSDTHEAMLRDALAPTGIPVLGVLRRDERLTWRDRHLGLVPVAESSATVADSLDRLAERITEGIDLAAVMALARTAPSRDVGDPPVPGAGPLFRVGVAGGPAFSFTYTDTLDSLRAAGAEIVGFDPLVDEELPSGLDGLLIGGGFPEVYASGLASNRRLLDDLAGQVRAGLPTWAECGGLLLLSEELDGALMAGVLPGRARMTTRLTLGYRQVTTRSPSFLGPPGVTLRGHEFHYSQLDPPGTDLDLRSAWGQRQEGWATESLVATYVHHHPGGDPGPIAGFAQACVARRVRRSSHTNAPHRSTSRPCSD
jgi:cobyrinic acid a,c-diamide synthase